MKYQIQKPCHLGQKGQTIELPERAAAHLVAAGLIAPVKVSTQQRKGGSHK